MLTILTRLENLCKKLMVFAKYLVFSAGSIYALRSSIVRYLSKTLRTPSHLASLPTWALSQIGILHNYSIMHMHCSKVSLRTRARSRSLSTK